MRKIFAEMFDSNKAKVQLGVNVELFRRTDGADYTSHQVMIKLLVCYAHFFFEHSRSDYFTNVKHNRLSVNIYYGLGPDSAPASPIKRHKHVTIWNFKAE